MSTLHTEHARLTAWLKANALEKAGTPEFRRANITHRILTDLIRGNGDPAQVRAALTRHLTS